MLFTLPRLEDPGVRGPYLFFGLVSCVSLGRAQDNGARDGGNRAFSLPPVPQRLTSGRQEAS